MTKFIKLNSEFKEKVQYEIMLFENPTRVTSLDIPVIELKYSFGGIHQ